MTSDELVELTRYCQHRAGDSLRAVFTYTSSDGAVLYARDDVRQSFRDGGFRTLRTAAWEVHTTVLDQSPTITTLGEYRVTVHTFEEAFVMQFRKSAAAGVAAVFDRSIGRNLHTFLLECEGYLD